MKTLLLILTVTCVHFVKAQTNPLFSKNYEAAIFELRNSTFTPQSNEVNLTTPLTESQSNKINQLFSAEKGIYDLIISKEGNSIEIFSLSYISKHKIQEMLSPIVGYCTVKDSTPLTSLK
jgi:hypothetical protein